MQPFHHQLDVFHDDSAAAGFTLFDFLHCNALHELAHGYDFEISFVVFVFNVLDHADRFDPGCVQEHTWFPEVSVAERVVDDLLSLQRTVAVCEAWAEFEMDQFRND